MRILVLFLIFLFKKIVHARNQRAHEAIDDINLLVENFNEDSFHLQILNQIHWI
jgi:hypothetical protein